MVFQSYALYPHMTVRQNIAFPLTLAKMSKADIATKVEETAKVLDLTDFLDRKPSQLSGGQRQRVAMGRAIVRNPEAFLMDEPLSNLDAKLRVQMRGEIARLQQRLGTTTVYVTHDQTEAMTLGDRVVVLRTGVAQQIGTPEELYERPANIFVAGFIGSPAMNFFPATLDGGGGGPAVRGGRADQPDVRHHRDARHAAQRHRRCPPGAFRGCRGDRRVSADQFAHVPDPGRTRGVVGCRQVRVLHRIGNRSAVRASRRTGGRHRRRQAISTWRGFPPNPGRRWARRWNWPSTPRESLCSRRIPARISPSRPRCRIDAGTRRGTGPPARAFRRERC